MRINRLILPAYCVVFHLAAQILCFAERPYCGAANSCHLLSLTRIDQRAVGEQQTWPSFDPISTASRNGLRCRRRGGAHAKSTSHYRAAAPTAPSAGASPTSCSPTSG